MPTPTELFHEAVVRDGPADERASPDKASGNGKHFVSLDWLKCCLKECKILAVIGVRLYERMLDGQAAFIERSLDEPIDRSIDSFAGTSSWQSIGFPHRFVFFRSCVVRNGRRFSAVQGRQFWRCFRRNPSQGSYCPCLV